MDERLRSEEKIRAVKEFEKKQKKESEEIDWNKYLLQPPKRKEIDPEKKLTKEELTKRLDQYFKGKGIDTSVGGSFDVREYPELIDEEIRDLVIKINNLDFVKTWACCSGHKLKVDFKREVPSQQVGRIAKNLEYSEPYITFLFNMKDPRSSEFIKALDFQVSEINKDASLHIGKKEEKLDERIDRISYNLSLKVPKEWIKKHNRRVPEVLDKEIQKARKDKKVIDPPKEEDFATKEEFQTALQRWEKEHGNNYREWENKYYFGLYFKEYGDYFDSNEARDKIKRFFKSIEGIVDTQRVQ